LPTFVVPPLFSLKYCIYEKLENENNLSFSNYKIEWDKVKPVNNYDLFTENPYEDSFVDKTKNISKYNIKDDKNFKEEFEI
jgi:hypothetical protein